MARFKRGDIIQYTNGNNHTYTWTIIYVGIKKYVVHNGLDEETAYIKDVDHGSFKKVNKDSILDKIKGWMGI